MRLPELFGVFSHEFDCLYQVVKRRGALRGETQVLIGIPLQGVDYGISRGDPTRNSADPVGYAC